MAHFQNEKLCFQGQILQQIDPGLIVFAVHTVFPLDEISDTSIS